MKRAILIILFCSAVSCASFPAQSSQGVGDPCSQNPASAQPTTLMGSIMQIGGNLLSTAATNFSQHYGEKLQTLLQNLITPKKKAEPSPVVAPVGPEGGVPQFEDGTEGGFEGEEGFDPGAEGQIVGGEEFEGGFDPEAIPEEEFVPAVQSRGVEELGPGEVSGHFVIGNAEANPCAPVTQTVEVGAGVEGGVSGLTEDVVPVSLDVLLVKKTIRNGTVTVLPIQDGEILRDGRGDPHAGDKFRIMFRSNVEGYIYVIAIDGSGWAQGLFPPPNNPFANPVTSGQQFILPDESNWFSMDQVRGVETIFFVASLQPRPDIEAIMKEISGRERPAKGSFQPVTQAAIIPNGYGQSQPSQQPLIFPALPNQQQTILPTSFFANSAGEDLRVTRWFRHQ